MSSSGVPLALGFYRLDVGIGQARPDLHIGQGGSQLLLVGVPAKDFLGKTCWSGKWFRNLWVPIGCLSSCHGAKRETEPKHSSENSLYFFDSTAPLGANRPEAL